MSNTDSTSTTSSESGRRAAAKPAARRPRRTQAERSDEMRLRLVEAAAAVLRKKGYAGLRIDEVSRVAKVSRGAQQHHFPSKDSLVLATAAHLLQGSLRRGASRAEAAVNSEDPVEEIIQDSIEFFLGSDFGVILDLTLAGTKDRALRNQILAHSRENRLGVEEAWMNVLCQHGLPRDQARNVVWLTISIVRGFSVRSLWQRDEALFRSLLDEWKLILAGHLKTLKEEKR